MGCSLGCGGATLLMFLIIVALFLWLTRSVPLPDPEIFVGPETLALGVVRPDLGQKGDAAIRSLEQMFCKGGGRENGDLGHLIRLAKRHMKIKPGERPLQIVWVAGSGSSADEESYTVAVSLDRFAGLFWVLRRSLEKRYRESGRAEILPHGSDTIFVRGDAANEVGRVTCVAEATLLLARGADEMRVALDRFRRPRDGFGGPDELKALLDGVPPDCDGFLVSLNPRNELGRWIWGLWPEVLVEAPQPLRERARRAFSDVVSATMVLRFPEEGARITADLELASDVSAYRLTEVLRACGDELVKRRKVTSFKHSAVGRIIQIETTLPLPADPGS